MNKYIKISLLVIAGVAVYLVVANLYAQNVIPEAIQKYSSNEHVQAFKGVYGSSLVATLGSFLSLDTISYNITRGNLHAELVIHVNEGDRMELNCYEDVFSENPVKIYGIDFPSVDDITYSPSYCGFN